MKSVFRRTTSLFLACLLLVSTGYTAIGEKYSRDNSNIGEIGKFLLGEDDITDENLFSAFLRCSWDCNDWNQLYALQLWQPNETIALISSEDSSNATDSSERYIFDVYVRDAVVDNHYGRRS